MSDVPQNLFGRVQRVFQEALDDRSLKITKDTAQTDIPEWDSMFQITLILAIEKEFGVRFSAREASQLVSVRAVLGLLETKNVQPRL
jgi:acyl carrier protein